MKKIINNKVYDTDTAKELGVDSYSNARDFNYWCERLYQKRTGEYFLYGEGGPASKYAVSVGQNCWSGGEKIIPLAAASARDWAEKHLDADDYEKLFGVPEEDEEDKTNLNVQIPAHFSSRLRAYASEHNISLTATVVQAISEFLK